MQVEVYSKPNCGQCMATKKWLSRDAVKFTELDMTEQVVAYGKSIGAMSAPIVIVRNDEGEITDSWGGFKPSNLKDLANAYRAYRITAKYNKGE